MFKKYKKGQNNTCFFKCKTEIFYQKRYAVLHFWKSLNLGFPDETRRNHWL